jgi:hypothetical protein
MCRFQLRNTTTLQSTDEATAPINPNKLEAFSLPILPSRSLTSLAWCRISRPWMRLLHDRLVAPSGGSALSPASSGPIQPAPHPPLRTHAQLGLAGAPAQPRPPRAGQNDPAERPRERAGRRGRSLNWQLAGGIDSES